MFGLLLAKLAKAGLNAYRNSQKDDDDNDKKAENDSSEKEESKHKKAAKAMFSLPPWRSKENKNNDNSKSEESKMEELSNVELMEGLGALFGGQRGSNLGRRSGKGRHAGGRTSRREKRKDGTVRNVPLSTDELRTEAGITKAGIRYDNGEIFQAYSGDKEYWIRTGTEIFMGMDDALVTITTATVGTFAAAPNKNVEIQGIRCQVVGAGATAAATIAIEETLLANLAFTYINVGDDKMITGANYVGANTLIDRETDLDLAGFVTTPTQSVTMGVLDSAGYDAKVFITIVGELVLLYNQD